MFPSLMKFLSRPFRWDLKEGYPWRACKRKVLCCKLSQWDVICMWCCCDGRIQNLQRNLVQGTAAIHHPWIMKSREQKRSKFHTKGKRNGSDRNIILGSSLFPPSLPPPFNPGNRYAAVLYLLSTGTPRGMSDLPAPPRVGFFDYLCCVGLLRLHEAGGVSDHA